MRGRRLGRHKIAVHLRKAVPQQRTELVARALLLGAELYERLRHRCFDAGQSLQPRRFLELLDLGGVCPGESLNERAKLTGVSARDVRSKKRLERPLAGLPRCRRDDQVLPVVHKFRLSQSGHLRAGTLTYDLRVDAGRAGLGLVLAQADQANE